MQASSVRGLVHREHFADELGPAIEGNMRWRGIERNSWKKYHQVCVCVCARHSNGAFSVGLSCRKFSQAKVLTLKAFDSYYTEHVEQCLMLFCCRCCCCLHSFRTVYEARCHITSWRGFTLCCFNPVRRPALGHTRAPLDKKATKGSWSGLRAVKSFLSDCVCVCVCGVVFLSFLRQRTHQQPRYLSFALHLRSERQKKRKEKIWNPQTSPFIAHVISRYRDGT